MTAPDVNEVYGYIQERCLWQFSSRAWDRTENIDGVLGTLGDLLTNTPVTAEQSDRATFPRRRKSSCRSTTRAVLRA